MIPIALAMNWDKVSSVAAITAAFSGQVLAVIAWLVTAQSYYGSISVDSLGGNYPMLAGNVTALLSSGIICGVM